MAKEYYDKKIGPETDWGGDSSTGGKQVKGSRVQEFIKEQLTIAGTQADYAKEQGDYAKAWNEHPPYIGDGTNGDKDYWYLYDITTGQYVKSSYAKGDDIDWETMTDEEYQRLVENVKQDLVFSSVGTCEDIIDELT